MVELPRKAVDEIRNELVSIGSRSGNDVIMDAVFRIYGLPVEDDLEPNLSAFRRATALGDDPAYQVLWPEETRAALHEGLETCSGRPSGTRMSPASLMKGPPTRLSWP
ncbi:hypothetical protein [Gluconobacter potus]|uniref:hypothetical protein n=1 Tax=Gluconobacter potus TaxID=2724927 RepID=UPI0012DAC982|nr:hypothetical protein [Gluconobacter potus]